MPFTFLDISLALIFIFVSVLALTQGVLRQLISLGVLYLSTAVVGLAYPYVAYFVKAIGKKAPSLTEAIVFLVLMLLLTSLLEALLRRWFPDTRLPKLGVLDILLAIGPGILSALIIISLILTCLGHSTVERWGSRQVRARTILANTCEDSLVNPILGQFMHFYMLSHRAWFPMPPPVLAYLIPATPDGP